MMTESSGNIKSAMFWVHLIFSLIGVSFNIIFIWIIKKTQKRRDKIDVTLMTACVCKVMIGGVFFVKAIVLKAWEIQEQHSSFVKVVDAIELFLDGTFIWNLLILNMFRFLLLKRLDKHQDQDKHRKQSTKLVLLSITFIWFLSVAYGVVNGITYLYKEVTATIIIILDTLIKRLPWVIIVVLQVSMMIPLYTVYNTISMRRLCNQSSCRIHVQTNANYNFGLRKVKQLIFSISYQVTLYILPSLFINCVEVLILYSNINDTTRNAYLIGKHVIVMLYPLSAGILLQPRRRIPESFLGLSRKSNQINHEEHAKNNEIPKHVRHKSVTKLSISHDVQATSQSCNKTVALENISSQGSNMTATSDNISKDSIITEEICSISNTAFEESDISSQFKL